MTQRLCQILELLTDTNRMEVSLLAEKLEGLSPIKRISKGFGLITGGDGRRIVTVSQVKPGDKVEIRIRDGKILAQVQGLMED